MSNGLPHTIKLGFTHVKIEYVLAWSSHVFKGTPFSCTLTHLLLVLLTYFATKSMGFSMSYLSTLQAQNKCKNIGFDTTEIKLDRMIILKMKLIR